MAVITPQTEIRLLKCPLELSDLNQLTFSNITAQYNYFNSLTKVTADNATYQRKDGFIRFPAEFDEIIEYNYVMYQNEAYSNKWFYAYIDHMEYLSNGSTAVYIKTDVFQTWQFDITFRQSFIEREHTMNDAIGANTIDEGLQLGEFVCNTGDTGVIEYGASPEGDYNLVTFQVTQLVNGLGQASGTRKLSGVYTGLYMFGVRPQYADKIIDAYASDGKSDSIVAIFYAPGKFFDNRVQTTSLPGQVGEVYYSPVLFSEYAINLTNPTNVNINTSFGSYTPKNNKLYCYPFNYLHMTNNAGSDVTYHYEDFASNTPSFFVTGSICQGCSIRLVPLNYKGHAEAYAFGMTGGKLPICAWASDYYTNWVTQNATNHAMSLASSALGLAFSSASVEGAVAGGLSAFNQIGGLMAEYSRAEKIPDQAKGNVNSGDVNFSARRYWFHYGRMHIKEDAARSIDDYFTMYGYKTNRVKVPNVYGRSNWNFVKTIGCYIQGDIPQNDMEELKGMLDSGITFWHNSTTFMDYSQTNSIVT